MSRYIVEKGSDSGHCCFKWSVMDTHTKELINEETGKYQLKCMCECFEKEDAENICNLLNKSLDTVDHP